MFYVDLMYFFWKVPVTLIAMSNVELFETCLTLLGITIVEKEGKIIDQAGLDDGYGQETTNEFAVAEIAELAIIPKICLNSKGERIYDIIYIMHITNLVLSSTPILTLTLTLTKR